MSLAKWILGTLGFVIGGGPIGAIIGVLIATLFENAEKPDNQPHAESSSSSSSSQSGRTQSSSRRQRATQGDIRVSLIVLMACVIKADGKVLKSEINFVKPFLLRNFGEQGAKQALLLLRELLKQDIDVVGVSQDIAKHVNYSVRLQLIHLMLDLANADDDIDPRELEVIEQMVTHMQVQWSDYQSMLSLYQRHTDPDWAYTALEITPQATDDEVKRAYRRMAMKYHPDKVATAGEDICRQATEKFRAINEAYEHIKQLRNMP